MMNSICLCCVFRYLTQANWMDLFKKLRKRRRRKPRRRKRNEALSYA